MQTLAPNLCRPLRHQCSGYFGYSTGDLYVNGDQIKVQLSAKVHQKCDYSWNKVRLPFQDKRLIGRPAEFPAEVHIHI